MTFTIDLPPWCWVTLTLAITVVTATRACVNIMKIKHLKRGLEEK